MALNVIVAILYMIDIQINETFGKLGWRIAIYVSAPNFTDVEDQLTLPFIQLQVSKRNHPFMIS
jgi:hypothetical protein